MSKIKNRIRAAVVGIFLLIEGIHEHRIILDGIDSGFCHLLTNTCCSEVCEVCGTRI